MQINYAEVPSQDKSNLQKQLENAHKHSASKDYTLFLNQKSLAAAAAAQGENGEQNSSSN